jgi:transcriptional regulator with XRE-family HTH domain
MTEGMAFEPTLDGGSGTEPELDREPWAQAALTELGMKIREARRAAGMVQADLGKVLDRTATSVSYWETGKRDPGIPALLRIAEALGVAAASLLPDRAPKGAQEAAPGRLARVEVKGFRDLGIVRVTESTLGGEAMLRAETTDGAVAEFPASSLHFITWLPPGVQVPERAAVTSGDPWSHGDDDDLDDDDRGPF